MKMLNYYEHDIELLFSVFIKLILSLQGRFYKDIPISI